MQSPLNLLYGHMTFLPIYTIGPLELGLLKPDSRQAQYLGRMEGSQAALIY